MLCSTCGEVNPATNRFCRGCGAPLVAICPRCASESLPGAIFCGACGATLGQTEGADRTSPIVSRSAPTIRSELKYVTVLFADLLSSTELVARLDAEEAMEHLKPALDTMCDAVERFEGTVVHTLGDGIMALFGAPRAHEGHALLACQAALTIRDAFAGGGGELSIRLGLHSGQIVAGASLTGPRSEAGAYGMTLHLGSRLPSRVDAGGICITEGCYRLIRSFCDVEPLGRHPLRGVPEPMELFLLKGLRPAVASQQFHGVSLTSLRGRDNEMSSLQRALLDVEAGNGRVVGVIGAPGTGKSRLCYEFAEWCRARLIPVFEARVTTLRRRHALATGNRVPALQLFPDRSRR